MSVGEIAAAITLTHNILHKTSMVEGDVNAIPLHGTVKLR